MICPTIKNAILSENKHPHIHMNLAMKHITLEEIIGITNNTQTTDNTNKTLALDHQHHSITDNKFKKSRTHMTETVFTYTATYVQVYTTWCRIIQKSNIFIIHRK